MMNEENNMTDTLSKKIATRSVHDLYYKDLTGEQIKGLTIQVIEHGLTHGELELFNEYTGDHKFKLGYIIQLVVEALRRREKNGCFC
jgi:hypothetical protein